MGPIICFALVALLAGCMATPLPEYGFEDLFYQAETTRRIVGGDPAPEGSAPYIVAMSQGLLIRNLVCGGSILTQRTVLTAAHCVEAVWSFGSLASSLRVTVGTNRWNSGGQTLQVERAILHPHYNSLMVNNDISLLITTTPIIFSNVVQPVQISSEFIGAGVKARTAGWGKRRFSGPASPVLLELYMETIDGDRCVTDMAKIAAQNNRIVPPVFPQIEVCTFHSNNHGMCKGDSGSALVRADNGQQFGIVSWGLPPCAIGAPDIFVRVSAYKDWLAQNIV